MGDIKGILCSLKSDHIVDDFSTNIYQLGSLVYNLSLMNTVLPDGQFSHATIEDSAMLTLVAVLVAYPCDVLPTSHPQSLQLHSLFCQNEPVKTVSMQVPSQTPFTTLYNQTLSCFLACLFIPSKFWRQAIDKLAPYDDLWELVHKWTTEARTSVMPWENNRPRWRSVGHSDV